MLMMLMPHVVFLQRGIPLTLVLKLAAAHGNKQREATLQLQLIGAVLELVLDHTQKLDKRIGTGVYPPSIKMSLLLTTNTP